MILAIDPGTTESGWVRLDEGKVIDSGVTDNGDMLAKLERGFCSDTTWMRPSKVAIEMIASYGMPVGREVFETCVWIGEFKHACRQRGIPVELIYRREVKLHLCGTVKAKDQNVWQALLDKFGGDSAVGRKAAPGPLYGVKSHARAALAVAVTAAERTAA